MNYLTQISVSDFAKHMTRAYTFLAKNYTTEDKIYLFGFNRGASAILALANMVNVDIVPLNSYDTTEEKNILIREALRNHLNTKGLNDPVAQKFREK